MIKEVNVVRVECPVCSNRLLDKVEGATGLVQPKCQKCKRVWVVDLVTNEFQLLNGKPYRDDKETVSR